MTKMSETDKN